MEQPLGAGEWLVTGYIACGCGSLPSGDHKKNYGKSQCLLGKSFFFFFNGHFQQQTVRLPEGTD